MNFARIFSLVCLFGCAVASAQQTQPQTQQGAAEKTYHHITGLEFRYPSSWITRDSSFADLELVPSDQTMSQLGPVEAYFLWGIGGVAGPSDPKLPVLLDALMAQIAPFLKRAGEAEPVAPGMAYSWSGRRQDNVDVNAKALVLTHNEITFALVSIGVQDHIAARQPVIRHIFSSFHFGPEQRDTTLLGTWKSLPEEFAQTQSQPQTQTKPQTQTQDADSTESSVTLMKDGSFLMHDVSPNEKGEMETHDSSGQWYGASGKLYFIAAESVSLTFQYELTGPPGSRNLSLLHATGGRQVLRESKTSN